MDFNQMFQSHLYSGSGNSAVRRRDVKRKKEEVVGRGASWDELTKALRLLVLVVVSVAALTVTWYILAHGWEGGHQGLAADCTEMKEIDQAFRSLGLDGLPGYTETCFPLGERLQTAAQPLTGPAVDLLKEVNRRLPRGVRRMVTFVPLLAYRSVTGVTRRLVDTGVTEVKEQNVEMESGDTRHAEGHLVEEVPVEEPAHPEDDNTDEEDTVVLEESLPVRQTLGHRAADGAIVLTEEDLKVLMLYMAALVGEEVDEKLDAFVQDMGSRRFYQTSPAAEE